MISYKDELYHHGIKGQKWGVRRYRNEDGSLTAAGKRKYDRMSDKKLLKTLKKQVRNARSEKHGSVNKWNVNTEIGKYSQAVRNEKDRLQKQYESTPEYKEWEKKEAKFDRKFVNKGGRELSIARLKDLGYDQQTAESLVNRLAKSGKTLGDI